jgi:hypothetical protein
VAGPTGSLRHKADRVRSACTVHIGWSQRRPVSWLHWCLPFGYFRFRRHRKKKKLLRHGGALHIGGRSSSIEQCIGAQQDPHGLRMLLNGRASCRQRCVDV